MESHILTLWLGCLLVVRSMMEGSEDDNESTRERERTNQEGAVRL